MCIILCLQIKSKETITEKQKCAAQYFLSFGIEIPFLELNVVCGVCGAPVTHFAHTKRVKSALEAKLDNF